MATYISSQSNRLYVRAEDEYGAVPSITASHRIPAVRLIARQVSEARPRRDKTGSRTFAGLPQGTRRSTQFELRTYLTAWNQAGEPGYGPLFAAALGNPGVVFSGGTVASGSTLNELYFSAPHMLGVGQAVVYGGEMRFVDSIVGPTAVRLNAPLSVLPLVGSAVLPAVTYSPATELTSVSLFDYWSPATAVQRIVAGAAIDQLKLAVNGDYHQFEFSGPAQDILDSASFAAGGGQLAVFPPEPELGAFDYTIVPGHLGQAWLGTGPDRFYTLTAATFKLHNDLELRAAEFGSTLPRAVIPGERSVEISFELYAQDSAEGALLYQAARQNSPISAMLQLGQAAGQLFGLYIKSVQPEVPEFDDDDRRLKWRFRESRAQGTVDDEVALAFG